MFSKQSLSFSGFFLWVQISSYTLRLVGKVVTEVCPIALLCVQLVYGSAEPQVIGVRPFEARGPVPSPPGFDSQGQYNSNMSEA